MNVDTWNASRREHIFRNVPVPIFENVLDKYWKQFATSWKKVRHECSKENVHELRVHSRRFIALLDLLLALHHFASIARLQKRLRKILKHLGPLRDIQVVLAEVGSLGSTGAISLFRKFLKGEEAKAIRVTLSKLHSRKKEELRSGIRRACARLRRLDLPLTEDALPENVKNLLAGQEQRLLDTQRKFDPDDAASLHTMRIAFRKLRYLRESAEELFGLYDGPQEELVPARQKLMGDLRDLQLFEARLRGWSEKRGRATDGTVRSALADSRRRRRRMWTRLLRSHPLLP